MGWPEDLHEMMPVPAGNFLMGSSEEEVEALKEKHSAFKKFFDREKPRHSMFVTDFRIGKYPVTNSQYAEFTGSAGHPPPQYWKGAEPPPELLTHPVVYVSWHDALKYCKWLSLEKGTEFRLPSEAEWEKAARGPDGFAYPWGNDFDSVRCNMSETGINSASPSVVFSTGKSPYGCMDMSGNVWEWCATKWLDNYDGYEDKADNDLKGDDARVLRGGSFRGSGGLVRCACRNGNLPGGRGDFIGFRVAAPGL